MRFFIVVFLMVCALLSATGDKEQPKEKIVVLHSGATKFDDGVIDMDWIKGVLAKEYPKYEFVNKPIDLSTGSTVTMDSYLASGQKPDIYKDTLVRTSKYLKHGFALVLNDLVDVSEYRDEYIKPLIKDGKVLALPIAGSPQGMAINNTLLKKVGYELKATWTVQDFLDLGRMIKEKGGADEYLTGMFAANQSGDYLIKAWAATFGVRFFDDVTSRSTFAETGGATIFEFFQGLVKLGYIPKDSAMLNDDDYEASWGSGKLAATAFYPGWAPMYIDAAMKQGLIKEAFDYSFIRFPTGKNTTKVPTINMYACVMGTTTNDTTKAKAIVRAMELFTGQEYLDRFKLGYMSNIPVKKAIPVYKDKYLLQVLDIMDKNGLLNIGLLHPKYAEQRPLYPQVLREVLTFQISPEEAALKYDKLVNEVLKN